MSDGETKKLKKIRLSDVFNNDEIPNDDLNPRCFAIYMEDPTGKFEKNDNQDADPRKSMKYGNFFKIQSKLFGGKSTEKMKKKLPTADQTKDQIKQQDENEIEKLPKNQGESGTMMTMDKKSIEYYENQMLMDVIKRSKENILNAKKQLQELKKNAEVLKKICLDLDI